MYFNTFFLYFSVTLTMFIVSSFGKPDYNSPAVPLRKANERFKQCCQTTLPKKCQSLCHYDVTMREVESAAVSGKCDSEDVQPFLRCANGGKSKGSDNRPCCVDLGVMRNSSDTLCAQFCNKYPTLSNDVNGGGDSYSVYQKYRRCASRLNYVMKCHHYGLKP